MAPPGRAVPAFARLAAHPLRWRLLTALAAGDHRVRELVALVGEPQNLVSYHLRLLRDDGLVIATRSTFDGRDTYYHLDLDRCAAALADLGAGLHPALRPPAPAAPVRLPHAPRVAVLFLCTGNSVRSPIAEGLLRHRTGGRVDVTSAGTRPAPRRDPDAARVLRDDFGAEPPAGPPRDVGTLTGQRFDVVVSLCDRAREAAPDFPGDPRRAHWSIPGHTGATGGTALREIAGAIDTRIRHLVPVLSAVRPAVRP
ncbi:arsenate reductase/protein-tyrosine-phosphatase family protein [Spirilliplanes yamanashiensis]|uniref:arsenate reductase/protein-tyrosine-phosphatase family protein n=1 Tax=Spirilliplanes yamanashiensis TaxID=42233 RepID=UPI00194F4458|nr:ArsR family transcriptional regulator [Spirilliplanes yamanashiensis]MDP9816615.1 protein-tyrosine-phosphatase/DNA-binding transcriptional ArsR family regulator [Spirilliplanes yamanashiensis]